MRRLIATILAPFVLAWLIISILFWPVLIVAVTNWIAGPDSPWTGLVFMICLIWVIWDFRALRGKARRRLSIRKKAKR